MAGGWSLLITYLVMSKSLKNIERILIRLYQIIIWLGLRPVELRNMIGPSSVVMPAGDYGCFGSFDGEMSLLTKSKNRIKLGIFIEVFRMIGAKTLLLVFCKGIYVKAQASKIK